MNSVKMDLSEQFKDYKDELDHDLPKLEEEIRKINLTLEPISKNQIHSIEDLIQNCENNVKHHSCIDKAYRT
jgi:hypothetical protein